MHEFSNGMTAEDLDRRLWLELTDEQYVLVRELVRIASDEPIIGLVNETDRVVAALAERFPAVREQILAAYQDIVEQGAIYEDGAADSVYVLGSWRPGSASSATRS